MRPNHCFYKLKRTTEHLRVAILQPGAFLDQKSASIVQQTTIFTHSNEPREICGVAILQPGAFLDETLAPILQPGAFLHQQSAARSRSVKKSSTISIHSGTSDRQKYMFLKRRVDDFPYYFALICVSGSCICLAGNN